MNTLYEPGADIEGVGKRPDGTLDLQELLRRTLESLVNAVMDEQADELCGDGNFRNGYRERKLATCVGTITMRIPKLREGTYFPSDIIVPYSRTDQALVGAIAEMYANGVSTRKVERVAKEMGFERISRSQVSRMCEVLDKEVAELREGELGAGSYPYLWLDATYVKCRDEGRVKSLALVTAIAASAESKREFVGLDVVDVESRDSWAGFLRSLRSRGLRGVACVVSDAHTGLTSAIREVLPGATWQRCIAHLERDVAAKFTGRRERGKALGLLKAVFAERDEALVREAYQIAAEEMRSVKRSAGELLEDAQADALAYLDFPRAHHVWLRTNNIQERANAEIKRRTKVVQAFPSVKSLIRLAGAVCCEVNDEWACMNFIDASTLEAVERRAAEPATEETRQRARVLIAGTLDALSRAA